jgi:hypothetical protein
MPDIDIDFADREQILKRIPHIKASRIEDGNLTKHNTGIYLQKTPVDLFKNLCSIPYNENDFFKIDFLNVHLYKDIRDEEHLSNLMNQEPLWELLEQEEFVNLLFHINGHGNILKEMKPKNIEQLAAVLAMIRPSKRFLIGKPWEIVMGEIWTKPEKEEYYFKKSHATAYAFAIVVQMNLICESNNKDTSN